MSINCRYYEQQLPKVGDIVMVKVDDITSTGGTVSLLEYDSLDGMILLSELSRRRIRSVNKLLRIGRTEVSLVIRVDEEKRYIDLSKRQITPEDVPAFEEAFSNAKTVNQIIHRLGEELNYTTQAELIELCNNTSWFLDRKYNKKGASYDIFKSATKNAELLNDCPIEAEVKEKLLAIIKQRLSSQICKIRCEFDISCFTFEGIEAIRFAIFEGLKLSTKEIEVKINVVAHPQFLMMCQTMEKEEGINKLNDIIKVIIDAIESKGGILKVTKGPHIVNNQNEENYKNKMRELEEVDEEGDEDSESNSEDESSEDE